MVWNKQAESHYLAKYPPTNMHLALHLMLTVNELMWHPCLSAKGKIRSRHAE